MKICSKCNKELPLDQFHARGETRRASRCKKCCKEDWNNRPANLSRVDPPKEKPCTKCGRILPASEFTKNSYIKSGLHSICKECCSENHARRMETLVVVPVTEKLCRGCDKIQPASSFTKKASNNDGLHSRCKECVRVAKIERLYKISHEQYLKMSENGCRICGSFDRLVIDHNHACCSGHKSCGKCVRGVLCDNHNTAIGRFNDDPALLQAAIDYLTSS